MALLVSCLAEGLFLLEGTRVERLDHVPSAGLATGPPGAARAVHDPAETATAGRILLAGGRSLRVSGLVGAHELAWDRDLLAAVATLGNAVLWIDRGGQVVWRWQAPGEGDCWHLSGIACLGPAMLVTAFGRFARHRDWAEADRDRAGFVVEIPSGRELVTGLSSPHSPRPVNGALAVCDSGRGELVVGSRRIRLGGWPRGVAVTERELVVGVSVPRGERGRAHLALLRRDDLGLVRRVPLPVREVFDVVELPSAEARALARPGRSRPETVPLRPADLRARIEAPRALRLAAGRLATVSCTVTNLGAAPFASLPPHPVSLVATWRPESRALRSPFPRPLEPGRRSPVAARVLAPRRPGRYRLELQLAQEGVAWLDGLARVEVTVA